MCVYIYIHKQKFHQVNLLPREISLEKSIHTYKYLSTDQNPQC